VEQRHLRLSHHLAYAAIRGFIAAAGVLPLAVMRTLGRNAARIAARFGGRDQRRARAHLAIAFPDLSEAARGDLLAATASHLGRVLGEVAWLRHASPGAVDALCAIHGTEHVENALAEGGGAVLTTAHVGNWELMNARLATAGLPMSIVVRSVYDPRLDRLITDIRSRFGSEVIPRGQRAGRSLLRALGRNRVIGLLIDQDIRDLAGAFVPFFGRPAWTPTGAATFAVRAGRPIVPAFTYRRPDGHHVVEIQPPLADPKAGSEQERVHALTAAATAAIEAQIRRHPEQWVWMHRRWRTQPEGDADGFSGAEA
jgi:KDO2-lipid IV(A) lauroyltransferase